MTVYHVNGDNLATDSIMLEFSQMLTMQQDDGPQIVAEGYKNTKYVLTFEVTMNPETESRSLNARLELLNI